MNIKSEIGKILDDYEYDEFKEGYTDGVKRYTDKLLRLFSEYVKKQGEKNLSSIKSIGIEEYKMGYSWAIKDLLADLSADKKI